jgi:uncharacterized paraquat-inducible protein A
MKCLPLVMVRGPLLAQVMREAHQDPRRQALCGSCGARIPIQPEQPEQTARCPSCLRLQRIESVNEHPWRLTTAAAEALRRTKSWVRYG